MKYETIYRCEFLFKQDLRAVWSNDGIAAFSHGFWINEALNFTKGSDCRYWIPPTRIQYIAKDRRVANAPGQQE